MCVQCKRKGNRTSPPMKPSLNCKTQAKKAWDVFEVERWKVQQNANFCEQKKTWEVLSTAKRTESSTSGLGCNSTYTTWCCRIANTKGTRQENKAVFEIEINKNVPRITVVLFKSILGAVHKIRHAWRGLFSTRIPSPSSHSHSTLRHAHFSSSLGALRWFLLLFAYFQCILGSP